jgi:hypothetical protein
MIFAFQHGRIGRSSWGGPLASEQKIDVIGPKQTSAIFTAKPNCCRSFNVKRGLAVAATLVAANAKCLKDLKDDAQLVGTLFA